MLKILKGKLKAGRWRLRRAWGEKGGWWEHVEQKEEGIWEGDMLEYARIRINIS